MKKILDVLDRAVERGDAGAVEAINAYYHLRQVLFIVHEQGIFDAEYDDDATRARTLSAEKQIEAYFAADYKETT